MIPSSWATSSRLRSKVEARREQVDRPVLRRRHQPGAGVVGDAGRAARPRAPRPARPGPGPRPARRRGPSAPGRRRGGRTRSARPPRPPPWPRPAPPSDPRLEVALPYARHRLLHVLGEVLHLEDPAELDPAVLDPGSVSPTRPPPPSSAPGSSSSRRRPPWPRRTARRTRRLAARRRRPSAPSTAAAARRGRAASRPCGAPRCSGSSPRRPPPRGSSPLPLISRIHEHHESHRVYLLSECGSARDADCPVIGATNDRNSKTTPFAEDLDKSVMI